MILAFFLALFTYLLAVGGSVFLLVVVADWLQGDLARLRKETKENKRKLEELEHEKWMDE